MKPSKLEELVQRGIFTPAEKFFRDVVRPAGKAAHRGEPVELAGREALDDLARRYGDDILFHGSTRRVDVLEPRQMSWVDGAGRRYPDGKPAIAADTGYDVPIFLALFKGRRYCYYDTTTPGGTTYIVGKAMNPEWKDVKKLDGYVYVLERKHFTLFTDPVPKGWSDPRVGGRMPELRAYAPVKPLAVVKVTLDDLRHRIVFE
jgi:hypothetical protein